MIKKFCILFAGMVGSSKIPIVQFLSCNLGVPIFDNDAVMAELIEDHMNFDVDQNEFAIKRDKRMYDLLTSEYSFVFASSIDGRWEYLKQILIENDYNIFIISIDLSRTFFEKLYIAKGYADSTERITLLYEQHEEFLKHFNNDISLHIKDEEFSDRLELSLEKVKDWVHFPK
ncbi:MAG: hypothetical protein ACK4NC_04650 [Candidatus Gracilibacteria bacterium]